MTVPNNSKDEPINGSTSSVTTIGRTPASDIAPKKRGKTVKGTSPKTAASKKTSGKTRAVKAASKRRTNPPEPSDADIRLRAYFIAEHRVQRALQGDPANDWLEAKRQLLKEAAVPKQASEFPEGLASASS